ncbi:hypothetical protein CFOL_v3_18643 [Cephalotus follicularis]|uniref:Uncharacterized protein n=1 Tax=Cephalotus follicularis TaxID=3775 RepID=A0A1Q3C4P4_CEPFO|nr:hypothetical protein CFOL_v3_18643 [Cephalotus follicularis]
MQWQWKAMFPEAIVLHFRKTHSDHCLVMIDLRDERKDTISNKAFRFEAALLLYPFFVDNFKSWEPFSNSLLNAIHIVSLDLKSWNIEVFGYIFKCKRTLLAKIVGIQQTLNTYNSTFL